MRPMGVERAGYLKSRLSIIYAVLAWNAFGVVCYCICTGKADWAKYHGLVSEQDAALRPGEYKTQLKKLKHLLKPFHPAQYYAKKLGIKNATVLKISGLDVNKYEIKSADEESEVKGE